VRTLSAAALVLFTLVAMDAQEPRRPRITGVAHVAFFASDLDKARAFYKELLGFQEPYDLKNSDGSLMMSFIKINDRQYVELSKENAPGTDRLNHVSIETDDVLGMHRYLAAKGVAVGPAPGKVRIGNLAFNVKDPDGHTLEFVQYTPDGLTVKAKGKFVSPERVSDRMAHFGIIVGNVEASMKFYRDILGFVETWRGGGDPKRLSWINLRVPDGDDYVEFMLYDQLPEQTKRGSQHHICLFVPDINKARDTIESRASTAGYTRPLDVKTGVNRKRQLNLFDPDGSRIELMEPVTVDGKPTPSSTAPPPRG
jgi:catechol 2,3-dioxygenase-like lactoylglutathione lyase family enzyme